jgi:hypothetical protein
MKKEIFMRPILFFFSQILRNILASSAKGLYPALGSAMNFWGVRDHQ